MGDYGCGRGPGGVGMRGDEEVWGIRGGGGGCAGMLGETRNRKFRENFRSHSSFPAFLVSTPRCVLQRGILYFANISDKTKYSQIFAKTKYLVQGAVRLIHFKNSNNLVTLPL